MNTDELNKMVKAYWGNYDRIYSQTIPMEKGQEEHNVADRIRHGIATAATVIDYLRGNLEGLSTYGATDPILDRALEELEVQRGGNHPKAVSNSDPTPLHTETMKRLGELGLQSLSEVKGFKYDSNNHFLLLINNRYADTGWEKGDEHIYTFVTIVKEWGLVIPYME